MAKKKVNVRKDYSYEAKKRLPAYKPAKIQRKSLFLILRGPGMDQSLMQDENAVLKKFADSKHMKLKFVQVKTAGDAVKALKDANTWAGGAVFNSGDLEDEGGVIKKTLKGLLINIREVSGYEDSEAALGQLIQTQGE